MSEKVTHLDSTLLPLPDNLRRTVRINSCLNSYRGILQQGPLCEGSEACVIGGPNNADVGLEPMQISQALPPRGCSWAAEA